MPMPIRTPTVVSTLRNRLKTTPTPAIWPTTYVSETTIAQTTAINRAVSL